MTKPDTTIDWSGQIDMIRRRFEASLRAGDTFDGLEAWLKQVPDLYRDQLRDELDRCRIAVSSESVETRVLATDASLAGSGDRAGSFSVGDFGSTSAVADCKTFAGLSSDAGKALQARLIERSFPLGASLLIQGESATGLHLILSGCVDIVDTETGERIDVDGAGSVLGEMSLLTDQPCSANVVATSNVTSLSLGAADYRELIAAHPELEIALSQLVSDRLGGRNHDALCGKTIGKYQLVRCISRGGMGVVYEAFHRESGAAAALKMLRHRFIYDDAMQDRFDQEAMLLAELRHENVVSFQENFLAFRTRFLVLDLCDGSDLFRLLRERGPFDEATTRAMLGQLAKGLQYAHRSGVVHRDLKPGNVLVDRRGCAKLTDFGLSRLLESEVPDGKAVGTPSYMPPEQFCSENVGPECDWYALGCLACEMLTGRMLFRGSNWRELFEEKSLRKPSDAWPPIKVSDELRDVVAGALAPKVKDRRLDLDKVARWADIEPVRAVQDPS